MTSSSAVTSDRIGLIVFGNAPYIQAPFSQDHDIVRYLLDQTEVRMAGPQTMLGDAIGFAITRFEDSDAETPGSRDRVLILLTDGNDTGSKMPPDKAAHIAKGHDLTIHTIAVGDPTTVGEEKLDEDTLREIASETGGQFFRANDRTELEGIYRELDAIAPRGGPDTLLPAKDPPVPVAARCRRAAAPDVLRDRPRNGDDPEPEGRACLTPCRSRSTSCVPRGCSSCPRPHSSSGWFSAAVTCGSATPA